MNRLFRLLLVLWCTLMNFVGLAQVTPSERPRLLSIKLEVINSDIRMISADGVRIPVSLTQLYWSPRLGYSVGALYQRTSRNVKWQQTVDASLLARGFDTRTLAGQLSSQNMIYYLNATPCVGWSPSRFLTFSIGPTINFLVAKNSVLRAPNTLEAGALGRLSISIGRFGVYTSYVHPLNRFFTIKTRSHNTYFLQDRQWRFGISYPIRQFSEKRQPSEF